MDRAGRIRETLPAVLPCFAAALLCSALLLFSLQPLVGRLVLPLLGGTPAVWTTCMLFFQLTLLLGYLYAHGLSRLSLRLQVALHLGLALLGLASLPISLAQGAPPPEAEPTPWLLGLLSRAVLPPLFVVSATAPLLQRWFSQGKDARDPYSLYIASNLGSLGALLAYPTLIEPHLSLRRQGRLWSAGYLLLIVLLLVAGALSLRRADALAPISAAAEPPLRRARLRWLALSAVPASLLLGVTAHLATDIAAVPLLWVMPLAIYLLSFILAFLPLPPPLHQALRRLQPLLVLALIFLSILRSVESALLMPVHLVVFAVICLVCHGELFHARPAPAHLTAFYLWLALGGALGGLFNALLAPLLFSRILEYPLALVLACMLLPSVPAQRSRIEIFLPVLVGLLCAVLGWIALRLQTPLRTLGIEGLVTSLVYALPLVLCYTFLSSPVRFGLGVGAVILAALLASDLRHPVRFRGRSFFGVLTVQEDRETGSVHLLHGTTLHGKQAPGERRREPLSYFHRNGPVGEVFAALGSARREIALVGLGAGALAAYGRPGQRLTFYEIDPLVVRVARDPRLFTYLSDSRAEVRVVIGDARLRLREAPAGAYDIIVLDAFSSDAIPVHLLTREALALYLEKLAPGGALALHVSNRYFRLAPVVGRLAMDAGLTALRKEDAGDPGEDRDQSNWVVLARSAKDLAALPPGWEPAPVGEHLWTDDFADPLGALR